MGGMKSENIENIIKSVNLIDGIFNKSKIDYYFKINTSKLQNVIKLENQLKKIIDRLIKKNNIKYKSIKLKNSMIDNDFLENKFTLSISFK